MIIEKKNGQPVFICDTCGKISSFNDLQKGGGGSWKFVPASDMSYEEFHERCKKCTNQMGKPIPAQDVVEEMCCGVY